MSLSLSLWSPFIASTTKPVSDWFLFLLTSSLVPHAFARRARTNADATRIQLRKMERSTINPNSKFIFYWDQIIVVALLYTAFVTPYEVAFLQDETMASFVLNRLVDVIFFCDMIFNFLIPYRNDARHGGQWVYDNRKIACAYLKGWFVLDLITTIPFGTIINASRPADVSADDSGGELSETMLRAVRIFRVVKLARILRASRIIKRWQDYIGLSFAMISLYRFLILVLVLAHWLACVWGYMGSVDHEVLVNREWTSYEEGLTWRDKARVYSQNPADVYAICL